MSYSILDHQKCRLRTCLLCFKKAKTKRVVTERVKDLIEEVALPYYRRYCDLISLPKVICETCRKKLEKKRNGKNVTITVPILSKFLDNEMLPTGLTRLSQLYISFFYHILVTTVNIGYGIDGDWEAAARESQNAGSRNLEPVI